MAIQFLMTRNRQRIVSNTLLGRVYSASRFISWGVGPIGAASAAIVGEVFGIQVMFAIGGITSMCLMLLFLRSFPSGMLDILD